MPHILISYRRTDSDAIAGRIRDRLANCFGENSVFMDIDSIPFGIDFREHIKQALTGSDIVLAVIGPKWLGPTKGGRFRIAEETDPVRMELEVALKNGSTIIPVLVSGARMPKTSELPDSLKAIAYRNAAEVDTGRDFHQHMERLIRSMDLLLATTPQSRAGESKERDSTADAGGPAPAVRRPTAAAAVRVPEVAGTAEPQNIALATKGKLRPYSALWIGALCVLLIAGLGTGAWLYLRHKDEVASTPTLAPTPRPATTTTAAQSEPLASSKAPAPKVGLGCKPLQPAAFEDNFKSIDPGWGLGAANSRASFTDGGLALKPAVDSVWRTIYSSLIFKNATVCAHIKSPSPIAPTGTEGGLVFWATKDGSQYNYYKTSVYPDGRFRVSRFVNPEWYAIVPATKSDSVKVGAGMTNEMMVAFNANAAALYINGQNVAEFRGQPSRNGGSIGVTAQSDKTEESEWRFLDIVVVENQ